jgi:hypothetical protein
MSLVNTNALCTLAALKSALGIAPADTSRDAELETRIKAASTRIETYCARTFKRVVGKVEKLAGYGTPTLLPSLTPVESIASVTIDGSAVDVAELDIEDGVIVRWQNACFPRSGFSQGGIDPDIRAGFEQKKITLTYTGGYVLPNDGAAVAPALDTPADLQEACAVLAADMDRRLTRDGNVSAESTGDASIQFAVSLDATNSLETSFPAYVKSLLSGYRRAV